MSQFFNKKAFSLVELSIVLIIIGLLVAGVSSGSKLIHTAKVNKFITELGKVEESINVFRSAYDEYPGDFTEATAFWGTGSSNSNGNGDHQIDWVGGEAYRVWLHLAKAEIIPDESFTGSTGTKISKSLSDGGFWVWNTENTSGSKHTGYSYTANGENIIQFGESDSDGSDKLLIPRDSYRIDLKIDDGKPREGNVTYRVYGTTTDASCTNSTTSYYLDSTVAGCNLVKIF